MLKGTKIILGVSGGIAAYKACEILRELQKQGAQVRVLMTPSATKMIGIETFQALSQNKVIIDIFNDSRDSDWFEHIDLSRWADLLLIAPATANTIAHLANGLTPDMIGLMALATQAHKIICPAMNTVMLNSPPVQRNLQTLREYNYQVVESSSGILACGEVGSGRLPEPEIIVSEVIKWKLGSYTKKQKILITAGRTHEAIDPVRYISNTSSGLTGLTFAKELLKEGYEVLLLCGPIDYQIEEWIPHHRYTSTAELNDLLNQYFESSDVFIQAAAVADYRPSQVAQQKIKDSRSLNEIQISKNPDLLRFYASRARPNQYIVGFALETQNIEANALRKLDTKNCQLLVVNNPVDESSGFGKSIVYSGVIERGESSLEMKVQSKEALAGQVIGKITTFFNK